MSQPEYGSPPSAGSDGSPGQVFGDYVLLEQLSQSKTGTVWKAQHRTTGAVAAVKTLSRAAMTSTTMIERFRRQVQIMAQLRHPNLIAAYEGGRLEGVPYLVMEHIEGQDLRSSVKSRGPLPVQQAVEYIIQAAAALGCVHGQGIWHRNVKPGNLMVDRSGAIRVTGFGLAHVEAEEEGNVALTVQGQAMGTGDYMAPEQALDSSSVDARADIYGLGCTLCMLLTGRPPYRATSWVQMVEAHLSAPIPSLSALRQDVPPALDAVFQKMLAKRPKDRYATMEEVVAALQGAIVAGASAWPGVSGAAMPAVPSPGFQTPVMPAPAWPAAPGTAMPAVPSPGFQTPGMTVSPWPDAPTAAWPASQEPALPPLAFPSPVSPTAPWPSPQEPVLPANLSEGALWDMPLPSIPQPTPLMQQTPLSRADFAPAVADAQRSAKRNQIIVIAVSVSAVLVMAAILVFVLASRRAETAKTTTPDAIGEQAKAAKKPADKRPDEALPSAPQATGKQVEAVKKPAVEEANEVRPSAPPPPPRAVTKQAKTAIPSDEEPDEPTPPAPRAARKQAKTAVEPTDEPDDSMPPPEAAGKQAKPAMEAADEEPEEPPPSKAPTAGKRTKTTKKPAAGRSEGSLPSIFGSPAPSKKRAKKEDE